MAINLSRKIALLGLGAFFTVYVLLSFAATLERDHLPDFSEIESVAERKEAFTQYLLPRIHFVQGEILSQRDELEGILASYDDDASLDEVEWLQLRRLAESYLRRDSVPPEELAEILAELDLRVGAIPTQLTLAQAALESGWGTSYYAREGNNLFGMRCFTPGCGLRPRWSVASHGYGYSRYRSPTESIRAYMLNLNRHNAYTELRMQRHHQRLQGNWPDSHALTAALEAYAENPEYIAAVRTMMRHNPEWQTLATIH